MAGGDRQGATTDHSLSYGRKEQRSMAVKEPKELVKNFVPGALEQSEERQISTTDKDARALPLHIGIVEVGYNIFGALKLGVLLHAAEGQREGARGVRADLHELCRRHAMWHNLRRVLSIIGVRALLERLGRLFFGFLQLRAARVAPERIEKWLAIQHSSM